MVIKKIFNNNAVIALDGNEEVVATGLGLAFQKKAGDELPAEKIERVFRLDASDAQSSDHLMKMVGEIPFECIQAAELIFTYANERLQNQIQDNVILPLADHIHFALARQKEGHVLKPPFRMEIQLYYQQEYDVAIHSLGLLRDKLGIHLPDDEAAFITLHLVNAILHTDMPKISQMTRLLEGITAIIRYQYPDLDTTSINYFRLATHLRMLVQRVLDFSQLHSDDEKLYDLLSAEYPEETKCALRIGGHIESKCKVALPKAEKAYLIVHLHRVVARETQENS